MELLNRLQGSCGARRARHIGRIWLAVGTACALAALPHPVRAEGTTEIYDNNTGSTLVTVQASDENLSFSVPTVIPFVAQADGELIGPSADATRITNLSVFGIHVTAATVEVTGGWVLVDDAAAADDEDAIDFQFGVAGTELLDAADEGDDEVAEDAAYNLSYAGSDGDCLCIETTGSIARVQSNLVAGEPVEVATITWTLAAGNVEASDS